MSKGDDGAEAFALVAIVLIVVAVLVAVAIGWAIGLVIAALAAAVAREARRRRFVQRAGAEFDHTLQQKGLTLPIEDSINPLYVGGLDFKENAGVDAFDVLVYAMGSDEVDGT